MLFALLNALARLSESAAPVVACAVLLTTYASPALSQESGSVVVDARMEWVDTGVDLHQGDSVRIRTEAAWSNVAEGSLLGPDGYQSPYPGTVLADAPLGSLIGKVGDAVFAVGHGVELPSPAEGRLFLAMNDVVGTYADNRGRAFATIRITPAPEAAVPPAVADAGHGRIGTPPASPFADVSVSIAPAQGESHRTGDRVNFTATIANSGPRDATDVHIAVTAQNADIERISGACQAPSCSIARLGARSRQSLDITAGLREPGPYAVRVGANAREADPAVSNNASDSLGVAESWPPRSPSPWWYAVVAAALLATAATTARQLRRRHWRRRVHASAHVNPDPAPTSRPLAFTRPTVRFSARIEPVATHAGAIPASIEEA